jgi:hypothetical protein
MSTLKKNQEVFVLRFSDRNGIDTIKEHMDIMTEAGFVWYGKIGIKPMESYLKNLISTKSVNLLIVQPGKYYFAECIDYSTKRPDSSEYPKYYNNQPYNILSFNSWYKIKKIIPVKNTDVMESIIIKSSKNYLRNALKTSMSPMFKAMVVKEIILEDVKLED